MSEIARRYVVEYPEHGPAELLDLDSHVRLTLEPGMILAVWSIIPPRYPEELPIRWGEKGDNDNAHGTD